MTFSQQSGRFSPLEERLLAAVRDVLPAQAQGIFDGQVAAIKRVQRQANEIRFHYRRRGEKPSGLPPKFPRKDEDEDQFALAEVRFSVAGRNYKATLTCGCGRISDLAIRPSPAKIAFSDWDGAPSARLLSDPLIVKVAGPQPIPDVWREFLRRKPRPPRGWTFYDSKSAHRVTLDQGEFLILAVGDALLLHRIDPPSDVLFYLPWHEDGTPEPLEGDFLDIFRKDLMNPFG